ncbi:MAG: hypothetical protein GC160_13160 [Acidobacteria bacterium]|nr:hypothetical protein [Acidobacteriota bacterium]
MTPRVVIDRKAQAEIKNAVETVQSEWAPDVVRIRYNLGEDWTEDPSIFFRIVLSDEASAPSRLRETSAGVKKRLVEAVDPYDLGLQAYFNFRSSSEQAESGDAAWN